MKKILRNCKKMNIGRRVISVLLVIALVLGVLPLDLVAPNISKMITPTVHAAPANSRKANLTYNDLNDFVAYSIEYQSNAELYSEDTITLTINSGEYHTLSENFRSLGTSEWPFNGKIYITASYGDGWYFNTDKPLFDYVTDSVTINYAITDHLTDSVPIEIRRKFVDSTSSVALSPLFANHVKHGTGTSATWSVKSAPYVDSQDNVNTYNFSGLIGTLENAEDRMKERLAIVMSLSSDEADQIEFYDYDYVYDPPLMRRFFDSIAGDSLRKALENSFGPAIRYPAYLYRQ